MSHFKQLFAITLILISTSGSSITSKQTSEEYCYEEDTYRPQYKNLGAFTPYPFVKGNDTQIYNVPGCSAEKIWMLVRHGTTLLEPTETVSEEFMEQLRDEIVLSYANNLTLPEKGRLCEADFNLIKNWKRDTNRTEEQYYGHLTVSGWNELKDLGKDYRNAFPDIFGNSYSSENLRLIHTRYERVEASYKAFVDGLFGDGSYNGIVLDLPPEPNMLQTPFELCQAFRDNLIAQNGPDSETTKFRNSEIFLQLLNDVSVKLGYYNEPLSPAVIFDIYDMCRYQKAWNVDLSSPWCSVFTPSQFKIIDYYQDLSFYTRRSYGSAINSRVYCAGVKEMLNHLSTDASPKVVAYFGHTFGYLAYLTAMGAFKDTIALRSDNFEAMENRKFKNSEINPVASNVAAVKYNCPSNTEENVKVKFFVNQKTLNFDWCDDSSGVCNLSDVLEQYSLFRNGDCEEIYCSTGDSSGDRLSSKLVLILFFSLALVVIILR